MSVPLEFVVLYEKNYTYKEVFVFYLQWTGNEEAITLLEKITSKALYEDYEYKCNNEYSFICVDIENLIPESAVDIHCRLIDPNSYCPLFTKLTGKFKCPFKEEDYDIDEYELPSLINEELYDCRIRDMFS